MQRWTRGQIGGATSLRKRKNLYQTVDQVIVTLDKMKMSKRKWKKKGDDEKEKNLESDKQEPYWRQECDKSNEERPLVMIKELEGYFYLYIYIYIYIYQLSTFFSFSAELKFELFQFFGFPILQTLFLVGRACSENSKNDWPDRHLHVT